MGNVFEQVEHFDEDECQCEISNYGEDALIGLHNSIQRKLAGAITGSSGFTGSIDAVGPAVPSRWIDINSQRMAVIKGFLDSQGWTDHDMQKRDFLRPDTSLDTTGIVIRGTAAITGHPIGHTGMNVDPNVHIATSSIPDNGAITAIQVSHRPEGFAPGIQHGGTGQPTRTTNSTIMKWLEAVRDRLKNSCTVGDVNALCVENDTEADSQEDSEEGSDRDMYISNDEASQADSDNAMDETSEEDSDQGGDLDIDLDSSSYSKQASDEDTEEEPEVDTDEASDEDLGTDFEGDDQEDSEEESYTSTPASSDTSSDGDGDSDEESPSSFATGQWFWQVLSAPMRSIGLAVAP